jgi:hypothetical protein
MAVKQDRRQKNKNRYIQKACKENRQKDIS